MTKEVMQQAFDLIERLNQLKSVLCDPEGKCCIAGSDEDRAIVDRALEALAQPPLPVQPEPLEYWNAVEGWVKIDEVREHFDAVNCGTIYKHGGEGRVPLYTAPPQQQAEPPPEWLLIKNILDEYGLQALDFVAEFKAAQQVVTIWKQPEQQAPFSPEAINTTQTAWKMGYEAAKAEQQQAEPVAWDKPSASFDEWWDSDRRRDNANPFTTDSFAYWAFEGWQAALAQRPWVGLTVEERNACLVSADPCEALADPEAKQLMEDIEEKLRSKNT